MRITSAIEKNPIVSMRDNMDNQYTLNAVEYSTSSFLKCKQRRQKKKFPNFYITSINWLPQKWVLRIIWSLLNN